MRALHRALLVSALLLAGGAGIAAVGRVPDAHEPLDLAALPWTATDAPTDGEVPGAILYVQASCPHCARAARLVDSLRRAHDLPVRIVAGDARRDADAFARRAGLLGPVVADSTRTLARAADVRAVPTLLVSTSRDRVRRLIGAELPAIRQALAATVSRQ